MGRRCLLCVRQYRRRSRIDFAIQFYSLQIITEKLSTCLYRGMVLNEDSARPTSIRSIAQNFKRKSTSLFGHRDTKMKAHSEMYSRCLRNKGTPFSIGGQELADRVRRHEISILLRDLECQFHAQESAYMLLSSTAFSA